ncbi:hypothetical protein G6F56_009989 [Rhizopus delemar]|nr:hypothetical protein G6F56_009989 [Rhizopus delemar]
MREINECNPHAALYKPVYKLLENNQESSVVISPSLNLRFIEGNDRRTENLPISNEIAAIIPTSAGAIRMHNQSKILADLYNDLEDALINQDTDVGSIVTRLILSSSFVGEPRFMAKQYQDAIAIVRYFRTPSLFITFTANPRWEEITAELSPGQTAIVRPDLVCRVLNLKLRELTYELKNNFIFGRYKGLV